MKRTVIFLLTAIFAVSLAACGGGATPPAPTDTPTPSETPAPSATPTQPATPTPAPSATPSPRPTWTPTPPRPEGPSNFRPGMNPLTGLMVEDPDVLERRPLLIKISNAPPVVRPQSGLNQADMIFEYYVEGGFTRFAALFYGQGSDHVGPVRSGRLVDLQLAPAYDALLTFSGASLGVTDTIRESDLYPWNTISPQFGYGEPYFVRFPREGLEREHTLFTDTAQLWQWAEERNVRTPPSFRTPGFAFNGLPPENGVPASVARLDYSRTSVLWRYDPAAGQYLRWTDGLAHTDALTGEQMAFENVIIIGSTLEEVDLFPEKYFGEETSLYIEMEGGGPATLLRDGQAFDAAWERPCADCMITLRDPADNFLPLKPGRTFIQIIRTGFEQLIVEP